MSNQIKAAGMVIQMRLNPDDIMGCIDVIEKSSLDTTHMSISMICRLVLSGYLQASRDSENIPTRDGYEYMTMVSKYANMQHGKKVEVTRNVMGNEANMRALDKPSTQPLLPMPPSQHMIDNVPNIFEQKKGRLYPRAIELDMRFAADGDNFDPTQMKELIDINTAIAQLDAGVDVDISKLLIG